MNKGVSYTTDFFFHFPKKKTFLIYKSSKVQAITNKQQADNDLYGKQ